jgi:hypothetical protein
VANLEYVVAGYVIAALALVTYFVRLHLRARAAARQARAIAQNRAQ